MLDDVTFRLGNLTVRPLRAGDGPVLQRAAREGGETHPYSIVRPFDAAYLHEALEQRASGDALPFAIELDGQFAGSTRYADIRMQHRALEIGWTWYVPRVRRTWLNAAVKQLLLGYAFETLGFVRVALKCDARNVASRRAIAALGAIEEGVLRKHMRLPDGFFRDTVMFSIVVEEWPQVRERLRARIIARGGPV